jgi:hypothetical protein
MLRHSTIAVRPQPPEGLIDFACSDSFRDHFAAQGLTFAAGRSRPAHHERPSCRGSEADEKVALEAVRQETEFLRQKVLKLEARLAILERQAPTHEPSAEVFRGVAI